MKGFGETARWWLDKIDNDKTCDLLSTERLEKTKIKFADLESSFTNFDALSFYDKIDLVYFWLDNKDRNDVELNNAVTIIIRNAGPDSDVKKFLLKSQQINTKLVEDITHPKGTFCSNPTIDEQISLCISCLYGADLHGIIYKVITEYRLGNKKYTDLYELLEITSAIMEQKESFEVEKDVHNMWLAAQRDKKLESLLSEL